MPITDPGALLERLCQEPSETAWVEFKENNGDPDLIGRVISAGANAAILAGRDRAFIVFGVRNSDHAAVGTSLRLSQIKKGGENLENWLARMLSPSLMLEVIDFEHAGLNFGIIAIETSYERPVRFASAEWIRVGENTKKLSEFPEHERALWLATGRRKFEDAVALSHQTGDQVFNLLDVATYYVLSRMPRPTDKEEILSTFCKQGFLKDDLEGTYDITNLGALLFAKNVEEFPSIERKTVRVIRYAGRDKRKSTQEIEGKKGYAVGFSGLLQHVKTLLPYDEQYREGIRVEEAVYPEIALREVIANAMIHQDFTVSGTCPVVDIYQDRIEITNPGNSLIELDRIIDERRSRNEKLAGAMRSLRLCEERGGGLDKALMEIEELNLPAPAFHSSSDSMRVVLFGPRPFRQLAKSEKMRACFYHCIIKWIASDPMSNASLRERFRLADDEYQVVSTIISESVKAGRIKPLEEGQGKRNARYIPYFA